MVVTIDQSPTIISSSNLSFLCLFYLCGAAQSFTIGGAYLTHMTTSIPSGYELSIDQHSWNTSLSISQSGGNIPITTIYIRLSSSASNGDGGNISLTSSGATTQNIATGSATIHTHTAPTVDAGSDVNFTPGMTIAFDAYSNGSFANANIFTEAQLKR